MERLKCTGTTEARRTKKSSEIMAQRLNELSKQQKLFLSKRLSFCQTSESRISSFLSSTAHWKHTCRSGVIPNKQTCSAIKHKFNVGVPVIIISIIFTIPDGYELDSPNPSSYLLLNLNRLDLFDIHNGRGFEKMKLFRWSVKTNQNFGNGSVAHIYMYREWEQINFLMHLDITPVWK